MSESEVLELQGGVVCEEVRTASRAELREAPNSRAVFDNFAFQLSLSCIT